MSTLFIQEGRFVQRWGWSIDGDGCAVQTEHFPLAETWAGQQRCVQVQQLNKGLDAAVVDMGTDVANQWAMMPLKGRKLEGGQKIWATVKRLPRDDKGCTLSFMEPARSNVAVGSVKEMSPMGFEPPYAAARTIIADSHTFVPPANADADIRIDAVAVEDALGPLHPTEQITYAPPCNLLIEAGRTLTAIDVNAAPSIHANLQAVPAIAKAIWQHNLGGLIVVDFLRPPTKQHRQEVTQALIKALENIGDQLPPEIEQPVTDVATMDHRGLVIIERERVGSSRYDLSQTDPDLIAISEMLERALTAQQPRLGQRLGVSPWAFNWLHRSAHRRAHWQDFLELEMIAALDALDYRWCHDG